VADPVRDGLLIFVLVPAVLRMWFGLRGGIH
jgi:hypothetical protein